MAAHPKPSTLNPKPKPSTLNPSCSGKKEPPPPEIAAELLAAEKSQAKMHALFLHYLGCKGQWKACTLVIAVRKRVRSTSQELWGYFTPTDLANHLKSEALAQDLMARHKDQERKLPASQKGFFIRKSLG